MSQPWAIKLEAGTTGVVTFILTTHLLSQSWRHYISDVKYLHIPCHSLFTVTASALQQPHNIFLYLWIFIYLHPCLHGLSNSYIYAQIHGSPDSSVSTSTNPWILISLYIYNYGSTDLMVSTSTDPQIPISVHSQICISEAYLCFHGSRDLLFFIFLHLWIYRSLTSMDHQIPASVHPWVHRSLVSTSTNPQILGSVFAQICISLPPWIYRSQIQFGVQQKLHQLKQFEPQNFENEIPVRLNQIVNLQTQIDQDWSHW